MIKLYSSYTRSEFLIPEGVFSTDEMYIVLSGSFRCTIDGTEFVAKENDVVTIPKNSYFYREVLSTVHYLYVQFDCFPVSLKTGVTQVGDLLRLQNTSRYLEIAIKNHDRKKIEHYTNDILYLCNETDGFGVSYEDNMARQCFSYMLCNYGNADLNLDSLTAMYGLSKNSLISKYKRTYHTTPIADLINIRIEKSKLFLKRPRYPIHWVAKQCGFENTYYFSNTFKKKTGISPSKFRQLTLSDNTKKNDTE